MPDRWAACTFIEPFRIGGGPKVQKRFQVAATDHKVGNINLFVFFNDVKKVFCVHEVTTGAFLTEHAEKAEAIKMAEDGIADTPDFANQIKQFGDVMRFEVVEAAEAFRRLANGERE